MIQLIHEYMYHPKIISFNDIRVKVCSRSFEQLEDLSNFAKIVTIEFYDDELYYGKFKVNHFSFTDVLVLKNNCKKETMLIELLKIFNNINTLKLN